jgi:hypothetical protein
MHEHIGYTQATPLFPRSEFMGRPVHQSRLLPARVAQATMRLIFVDTYYYLALLNPRDPAHSEARALGSGLTGRLVTTSYVLTEVGDALASPPDRPRFLALWKAFEEDSDVLIVPASDDLFRRGVDLYGQRLD